ncbi:DUF4123 domain-containing protein [Burkholderia multivorans]|uniref:DUF4123 domain-containing protein n=1 Tax=Burkholderia multivorans TaxID=87883 RepID=UPI001C26302C|nr:DUF4123 domain-containing protein [Burkholderia multivorans]MBU9334885.1 DUF4123 domain-containing protein [Burkholderia multivorans]MDR8762495.1 hypothetical protein [Burkholderia multivorans]MDR8769161.1 hypothetical protein [Burkholderia multivorans]MDR8774397.1 hypothetical protein [Burkholderia multivorans]MDR8792686.1 hypothetical protein [Burkholderia multivorans]
MFISSTGAQADQWTLHVEHLRTSLLARTDGDERRLYLLVDTRAEPDLQLQWAGESDWRYVSLWDGMPTSSYGDIAPYLIAITPAMLDGSDSRHNALRRIWEKTVDRPMLTWIASPFDLDEIAGHLRRFCTFRNTALRLFYLHFYDNRVLLRLHQGFEPAMWQAFIAPFNALMIRDRRRRPLVWCNPLPPSYVPDATPLMLSDAQHRKLLKAGYPDKLAMQLRRVCDVSEEEVPEADWIEGVEVQLARAAAYGLKREQVLARYVVLGMLVSPTFDEHPAVRQALQPLADGEDEAATLDAVERIVEQYVDELTAHS